MPSIAKAPCVVSEGFFKAAIVVRAIISLHFRGLQSPLPKIIRLKSNINPDNLVPE